MKGSQKKVCHIINSLSTGGAESLLLKIIRNTKQDIQYTVYYIGGEDTLVEEFEKEGATVHSLGGQFNYDLRVVYRLYKKLQENQFDVLHAHLPNSHWIGRIAAYLNNISVIVSTHHSVPQNYGHLSKNLERFTRPLDNVTVAVSNSVRSGFNAEQNPQWRTIYNGIELQRFRNRIETVDINKVASKWNIKDKLIFLSVGRYVPVKNQMILIRAMPRVLEVHPKAHLVIVGWGRLKRKMERTIKQMGIENSVTITGYISDVEKFYALADIFVHPARIEGFGMVLIEAMAAHLPIIASDISTVREVVSKKCSFLVPPDDIDAFANKMIALGRKQHKEQFKKKDFEEAVSNFTIQQTVDEYMTIYQNRMENTT
jgi:glycosyltransferase involved in cell wall biosynthesis